MYSSLELISLEQIACIAACNDFTDDLSEGSTNLYYTRHVQMQELLLQLVQT